jgi:hypothetical protein
MPFKIREYDVMIDDVVWRRPIWSFWLRVMAPTALKETTPKIIHTPEVKNELLQAALKKIPWMVMHRLTENEEFKCANCFKHSRNYMFWIPHGVSEYSHEPLDVIIDKCKSATNDEKTNKRWCLKCTQRLGNSRPWRAWDELNVAILK